MANTRSLFSTSKPKRLLHPSFQILQSSPRNKSTRRLINDAFARFVEKDGNFIEQFQTTGFNTRTFELYVSELLHSEGFAFEGAEPHPDFCVTKSGVKLSIECTTANPSGDGNAGIHVYEAMNDKDSDLEGLRARQENEVPIKIAGALRNKMLHRVSKKTDPRAYWELARVSGNPFVLAIQTFHEHGSLGFSNAAVVRYLYGIAHRPSWDEAGDLIINAEEVREHAHGERVIPASFFDLPDSENVSAVLWTNAGTVAKFTRMALAGPYPDENVTMVRFGAMFDFDPNAHAPLPFAYIVGDPGAPEETWGQEAHLFHNPNAKYPIPQGLFDTVTDSQCVEGKYSDLIKGDFKPIMSMSNLTNGPGHRKAAMAIGNGMFAELEKAYAEMNERRREAQPQPASS
jgi:hypothetical protein